MRVIPPLGAADGTSFTDGNPAAGIEGSPIPAEFFNALNAEVVNVIRQGLGAQAPSATDLTQLHQAISALIATETAQTRHGECRLVLDGASLRLVPWNGNKLIIDGKMRSIPAAGIDLAPTGLTAGTTYYIYARMNGADIALEASTTGHAPEATSGIRIKAGDGSRTLVGMARPVAGPAWVDSDTQRFVRSWFNRVPVQLYAAPSTDTTITVTATVCVELSSNLRCEFLAWSGSTMHSVVGASASSGSAGYSGNLQIGFDGTSTCGGWIAFTSTAWVDLRPITSAYSADLTEGYHYATPVVATNSNQTVYYRNPWITSTING